MPITARSWFLVEPRAPLQEHEWELADPAPTEAVIEVWGNGVCHTDLGFADGDVRPNRALPLVLGHEAVGRVVAAGSAFTGLTGRIVVVPAVLPCGECELCESGHGNACPKQKMPGNDIDGAFSTHMLVPARALQVVERPGDVDVRLYGVVADAVSTAYQTAMRAQVEAGDLVVVVGAGGVGGFAIQVAAALGAKVVALDVSEPRLELMARHGAAATVHTAGKDLRAIRGEVQRHAREWGIEPWRTKILECSGQPAAQEAAFALIGRRSVMVQVGFTSAKTNVRLSNLMAFDATIHGSWGCPPHHYAAVFDLIARGEIALAPFVEIRPMREVDAVLGEMRAHQLSRRVVLDPRL
ncbi:MAG TPA: 6-hydroxycyclohex-1-ene-1-carbonyl-CoA dehydrogenase [Vulgatibacter sp.]|nr:6-hydroxycyclohex-1-ene-1-carbonyl-CoA dehydrogenase [Vulgatibacter sp.]